MSGVLYLFGLVDATEIEAILPTLDLGGIEVLETDAGLALYQRVDGPTVERLRAADTPAGLRRVSDWVLRHEAVGNALVGRATVCPFGFATLFSDKQLMREAMSVNSAAIERYFDTVRNADEWAVKICRRRQKTARFNDAEAATNGLDYLRRRRQERLRTVEATSPDPSSVLQPLSQLVREWRHLRTGLAPLPELEVVARCAALVPRENASTFRKAVADLCDCCFQDIELTSSGPWLPYSFRPVLRPLMNV